MTKLHYPSPYPHRKKKAWLGSAFIAAIVLTGCSAPTDDNGDSAYSMEFSNSEYVSDNEVVSVADDAEAPLRLSGRVLVNSSSFSPEVVEDNPQATREELTELQAQWEEEREAEAERQAEAQAQAEEEARAEQEAAEAEAEAQRQRSQAQQQSQPQQESSSDESSSSNSGSSSGSSNNGSSSGNSNSGGSSNSSSSPSPSPSPSSAPAPSGRLDIARQVMSQHGCSSVPVRDGVHGNWGYADWENGYVGIGSHIPDSQLRRVAAHECAHFLQWWAYDSSRSAMYESLNGIHGGSGMTGLERNADCMTILWGYGTGSNQYTNSCSSAEMDAARAVSGGNRAS